jgi:hypothetical protein
VDVFERLRRLLYGDPSGHHDPVVRAQVQANEHAKLDVGDEAAAEALRESLRDVERSDMEIAVARWNVRSDYLQDRGYRLLTAVRDSAPVVAMDPESASVFEAEGNLGRLPLPEGFARLSQLEPRLNDLQDRAVSGKKISQREIGLFVGSHADNADPLLRTRMSWLLVYVHLLDCTKGSSTGTTGSSSLFDRLGGGVQGSVGSVPESGA